VVVDRSAMLAADLWAVWWRPVDGLTAAELDAVLDEHLAWMLSLERTGQLFASGPITSGPGTAPGSGLTVLRAADAAEAAAVAAQDPFVEKGLRSFEVFGWRLMEGVLTVRLSFGTGSYGFT
jgi:uncharacterized protein